jgi:mRNA interferase YafQ
MRFEIHYSNRFKRQYKKLLRSPRSKIIEELKRVITSLAEGKTLEPRYYNHKLIGQLTGFQECHIAPDWLLIYQIYEEKLILELVATGTHNELF